MKSRIASLLLFLLLLAIAAPVPRADAATGDQLITLIAAPGFSGTGKAKYRNRGAERELQVEAQVSASLAGNILTVYFGDAPIGSMIIDSFGAGRFSVNSTLGQPVPAVVNGSLIGVATAGGTVLLAGQFGAGTMTPPPVVPPATNNPSVMTNPPPVLPPATNVPPATGALDQLFQISLVPGPGFSGKGTARYRLRPDRAEFQLEAEVSRRLAGNMLTVTVGGQPVGTLLISPLGTGALNLDTELGQTVPALGAGTLIGVTTASGVIVLAGQFTAGPGTVPPPVIPPVVPPATNNPPVLTNLPPATGAADQSLQIALVPAPGVSGKAKAKSTVRSGQAELQVEVEARRFAGSVLTVFIGDTAVGTLTVDALGAGQLTLSTERGQSLPAVNPGTLIGLTHATGAIVFAGRF